MADLIHDLFNYIPANIEIRDYKGFQQHRKIIEVRLTKKGKILFYWHTRWALTILGHSKIGTGHDSFFVAKSDGSYEELSVDRYSSKNN